MGLAWTPREGWDIGSWQRGAPGRASKTLKGVLLVQNSAWGHGAEGKGPSDLLWAGTEISGPPASWGGTGSYFLGLRRQNMSDPPGGSGGAPSPPRAPVSDPAK